MARLGFRGRQWRLGLVVAVGATVGTGALATSAGGSTSTSTSSSTSTSTSSTTTSTSSTTTTTSSTTTTTSSTTTTTIAPGAPAGQSGPAAPLQGVSSYLQGRQGAVQVAVDDLDTGTVSTYSDGTAPQATASIAKVDILDERLHTYGQQHVPVPGGVPYSITYLMAQAIQDSVNAAATSLFYFGGGCTALTTFNALLPTRNTNVGCQSPIYYGWGNTTTSAADQVAIVRALATPNALLGNDARSYGLGLMQNISPGQTWGITCGPWGTTCAAPGYAAPVPGVTVAMKDGWKYVPGCVAQDQICPWQMNSIGYVQGKGRNYVIAVLTAYDPAGPGLYGFNYGIDTIQQVSTLVWNNLAPSS